MSLEKLGPELKDILVLIKKYTQKTRGTASDVKVRVFHPRFSALSLPTQTFIQAVLKELYADDFKVLQADFAHKFGVFLSLISHALEYPQQCTDTSLRQTLDSTREEILGVMEAPELEADLVWLRAIGLSRDQILKLYVKLPKGDEITSLRQKSDTYLTFLDERTNLAEILNGPQGIEKLRRLLLFHEYCTSIGFVFNGAQLKQIVSGADWENKLDHFQASGELRMLQSFGFNSSQLANIVRGSDWEAKLAYLESSQNMDKLKKCGFNSYDISQIMGGGAWRTKLDYLQDSENLQPFFVLGFEPGHLAQIVGSSDWQLKFRLILKPSCLAALESEKLTHPQLKDLLQKGNWKERLAAFGISVD